MFTQRQYAEPNTVFRNLGTGKFQDVTSIAGAAFQMPSVNRGAAFGDLDNDGRMDLVVNVLNGKAKVFHNTTRNDNHWMLLKLTGVKSNRMGLGAQIRVTSKMVPSNTITPPPAPGMRAQAIRASTSVWAHRESPRKFKSCGPAAASRCCATWPWIA